MGTQLKQRTKRTFHRNGVVAAEDTYRARRLHGVCRRWHRNGQLALELSFRDGLLHGVCRQWNEDGKLLGTFALKDGTGVHRTWFGNGRLQWEQSLVAGKATGFLRQWLRDGSLASEVWLIENREVSRDEYLQAAASRPEWPDGAKARKRPKNLSPDAVEAKAFRLHCDWLLKKPNHRCLAEWLGEGKATKRSLGRLSYRTAKELGEKLRASGAERVLAVDVYSSKAGQEFADALLVGLPRSKAQRAAIRDVVRGLLPRLRYSLQPDEDRGEPWLYVFFG